MNYGICNLSIVAIRLEPSNTSEMTNQLIFGEYFQILETSEKWSYIRLHFDKFEGYIHNNQFEAISEKTYHELSNEKHYFSGELIDFITDSQNNLTTIPLGAYLPNYKLGSLNINQNSFVFDGKAIEKQPQKSEIINTAYLYLNTPYLWGGKTPFGIDCSGFIQSVYKLCGYDLPRNASEQAQQGEVLSFIEESIPGDLAFFDDEKGEIIHVGIIMNDYNIIHAHGKVRIDKLDHSGIYNTDTLCHTHKLRVIKRIIS